MIYLPSSTTIMCHYFPFMYYFLVCDCLMFSHSLSSGGESLNWQHFDLSIFDFSIKLRHGLTDLRKINSAYITVFLEIYQFSLLFVSVIPRWQSMADRSPHPLCARLPPFLGQQAGPGFHVRTRSPSARGAFYWQNSCLHSVSRSQIV